MTTQAQTVSTQAKEMTTQENWEVRPYVQQNASTMASRLRDFTRMNLSKVNEDPQNFLDVAMGVSSNEKAELASFQLEEVTETWYTQ